MYVFYNPNPRGKKNVGDCTVRAVSKALDTSWETAYIYLVTEGYFLADMPSANYVTNFYLHSKGFDKHLIESDNYTIQDFSRDFNKGTFVVGTGTHVVCVKDGDYFDTFDSGTESILYYLERDESVF